jgi:ribosomal protein S18 acetylase RimI-like enzyme
VTEVHIRPARSEDAAHIWQVLEPTIRAGETLALDRDMSDAEVLAYWLQADHAAFVAESDGEIVGTYYLRPNQGGGGKHICNCGYVTKRTAMGRGVARAMCEHSLQYARSRGYRGMQFNFVVSSNARAVALWRSMGFEVVGHLPSAFEHPTLGYVDALVLFRSLEPGRKLSAP